MKNLKEEDMRSNELIINQELQEEDVLISDYDTPVLSLDITSSMPYHHSYLTVGEEQIRGRLTR